MRLSPFLLISLALHIILAIAFLWRRQVSAPQAPPALFVDLTPSVTPISPVARGISRPSAPNANPFKAFAPVHKPNLLALRPGEVSLPAQTPIFTASENLLQSAAPAATGALAWVYRKAQFTIGYPEAFVHHDITGLTEARLVFDKTGKIRRDLLTVHSDSPYLRVYLYRVLENAFSTEAVPRNLVRWTESFEVFCYVRFSFSETEATVSIGEPIVGNKLFLTRRTFKSSAEKLKWDLGPLHGLFPIPVVGLDMLWFARKVDEHNHPLRAAAEADDLAPFRKDPLFYD